MVVQRATSSFLHQMAPGNTTFITKQSRGNRNRRKASSFCHSASSDEKTIPASRVRLSRSSVRTFVGVRYAPVGHPRYLYRSSHERAGMRSVPSRGLYRWSAYSRDVWLTRHKEPHLLALKTRPAQSAKSLHLSRIPCRSVFDVARTHTSSAYARALML